MTLGHQTTITDHREESSRVTRASVLGGGLAPLENEGLKFLPEKTDQPLLPMVLGAVPAQEHPVKHTRPAAWVLWTSLSGTASYLFPSFKGLQQIMKNGGHISQTLVLKVD